MREREVKREEIGKGRAANNYTTESPAISHKSDNTIDNQPGRGTTYIYKKLNGDLSSGRGRRPTHQPVEFSVVPLLVREFWSLEVRESRHFA